MSASEHVAHRADAGADESTLAPPAHLPPDEPRSASEFWRGGVFQHALPAMLCGVAALATGTSLALLTDLPREQVYMTGIFVLAALLWLTQSVPLFATSIVIIAAMVLFLANPGDWAGFGFSEATAASKPDYREVLGIIGSPILVLFFGGFILAEALVKQGVDKSLASLIVRPFRGKPKSTLAAVMVATAFLSMWMSNTAATAMMITLAGAMMAKVPGDEPFRRALVLGVAFAANIGGMGTPIGTPPNAVALEALSQRGISLTFGEWMAIAVPLATGLLVLAWLMLVVMYKPRDPNLDLKPESKPLTRKGWFTVAIFGITIALWLTGKIHGVPSYVVALFPAVVFTAVGIIGRDDVNALEWNILILIAGGLAIGFGMKVVGLNAVLADAVAGVGVTSSFLIVAALATATLVLANFMSHTAAANLIVPVGVTIMAAMSAGAGDGGESQMVVLAVSLALIASIAMSLPVSTPPNAIAFGTDAISLKELATGGTILSVIGLALIVAFGGVVITFWHQ
jgi:sodium-dependent dicarboxylate transporter 2/3/5